MSVKIPDLGPATLPLTGAEMLEIVQSDQSRRISVTELAGSIGGLDATFVVMTPNVGLANERILTAGAGIGIVDGGAGGNVTVSVNPAGAGLDASFLVLGLSGVLANERLLTAGTNVSFVDGGPGGTLTINVAGGGVTSFNSRIGAVVPLTADYDSFYLVKTGGPQTCTSDITINGGGSLFIDDPTVNFQLLNSTDLLMFSSGGSQDFRISLSSTLCQFTGSGFAPPHLSLQVQNWVALDINVRTDFQPSLTVGGSSNPGSGASWNVPHGSTPTTPVNGDFWTTTLGAFIRVNGTTHNMIAGTAPLSLFFGGDAKATAMDLGLDIFGSAANDNDPDTGGVQDTELTLYNFSAERVGALGYSVGTPDLSVTNSVVDGLVMLIASDSIGSFVSLFEGDPDGSVLLFYAGVSVARTETAANGGLSANNTLTGAGFERVLTVSDLGIMAIKTVDDTVTNSATLVDDSELAGFALLASTTYMVEASIIVSADNVAAGFRFALQTSSAFADSAWGTLVDLGTAATEGSQVTTVTNQAFTFDVTTSRPMIIRGYIRTSAAATVDFQFAQGTAIAASNTVLRIGSWIKFTPIQ